MRLFRTVALVEGISTLVLFLVAMPIKYGLGNPYPVRVAGLTHGVLFLVYIVMMCVTLSGRAWSWREWGRTLLAALLPFGTFVNDPFLKRKQASQST